MGPLRQISVTVIEPRVGFFQWQLWEATYAVPAEWVEIKRSARSYAEWLDAFNDGVDEVLSFTRDGRRGPR